MSTYVLAVIGSTWSDPGIEASGGVAICFFVVVRMLSKAGIRLPVFSDCTAFTVQSIVAATRPELVNKVYEATKNRPAQPSEPYASVGELPGGDIGVRTGQPASVGQAQMQGSQQRILVRPVATSVQGMYIHQSQITALKLFQARHLRVA